MPLEIAERAFTLLPDGGDALRRVKPDLMHITLAFLGEGPGERLAAVFESASAAAASLSPFDLALTHLGRFPERGRPRAIWIAPGDEGPAQRAAAAVRRELRSRGLTFDDKLFEPHVTLARVREQGDAGGLDVTRSPHDLAFRVDALNVVESVLSPKGPRYAFRHIARLGARR